MGSISKEVECCANCVYWGGKRSFPPNYGSGGWIDYDNNEKGSCNAPLGGGLSGLSTSPLNLCYAYRQI